MPSPAAPVKDERAKRAKAAADPAEAAASAGVEAEGAAAAANTAAGVTDNQLRLISAVESARAEGATAAQLRAVALRELQSEMGIP